mmetsp:Transcript_511/g.874  ORF Transcript_511/g.874 Transcript_511/m.874 type:complete len:110 (-) Transcript_511:1955-2284(-)
MYHKSTSLPALQLWLSQAEEAALAAAQLPPTDLYWEIVLHEEATWEHLTYRHFILRLSLVSPACTEGTPPQLAKHIRSCFVADSPLLASTSSMHPPPQIGQVTNRLCSH